MSTFEGFRILRDWYARKTILEVLSLSSSCSNWPSLMKARISSFIPDLLTVELIEEGSKKGIHSLNLAGAEINWVQPEDNPPPFEGVSATQVKGFLFMKLRDGKYLAMVERRPPLVN